MTADVRTLHVAEPPPAWRLATPLVVDCSVAAALLFDEAERDQAARSMTGHALHAPQLLEAELANVAVQKSRRGLAPDATALALSSGSSLPVTLHPFDLPATCALALRHRSSACDAAYLWLAVHPKAPLATFDRRLADTARDHLGGLA